MPSASAPAVSAARAAETAPASSAPPADANSRWAEPVTAATDAALALLACQRASNQYRRSSPFTAAFLLAGASALVGALAHALAPWRRLQRPFWLASLQLVVATGTALSLASTRVRAPNRGMRRLLVTAILMKWIFAATWVARRAVFGVAVASYALDLVTTALLHRGDQPGDRAMRRGVALSVIAAAAQRSGWRRGHTINHNDAYHLIQMQALQALDRGATDAAAVGATNTT